MGIDVDQELLDEVNIFLPDLIDFTRDCGINFYTMAFITQSIVTAVDNAQEALDNQDNL